ncbi:PREDICTED: ras-related protein Rab-36 [Bison bison bison]|uniref:Ras-related protein Rab-36 n=1 Tax=Bison bison bison TaxID=43346 RepID=A0A6P3JAZ7_BISBB|nr:PREDICTED: ras-related protein Rab-36 [Bison bison bison]
MVIAALSRRPGVSREALVAMVRAQRDSFGREPRPQRTGFVGSRRVPRGARCHGDRGLAPPGLGSARNCVSGRRIPGRMRSSLTPLGSSVSRDRVISSFPKWYTPAACLQLREHFHGQVSTACQRGNTGTVGLRLSKVVVVGDLYVGKTSLIHRFCKNVFDHDYKATIGVDFEIERFEVAGTPFSLQIWDTAGQEKFKCIASAYYRGAQVIITAFDLTDVQTLEHSRQWLEDALRENEPGACFVFLVGTKKDLLVSGARRARRPRGTRSRGMPAGGGHDCPLPAGENVKAFFSRVAALAFERSVLQDLERRSSSPLQVGGGDVIRMEGRRPETPDSRRPSGPSCC